MSQENIQQTYHPCFIFNFFFVIFSNIYKKLLCILFFFKISYNNSITSKNMIVSDKYKAENDTLLQEQLNKYKKQHKIIIICGVTGIIVGILGFIL